ncbi:MAG: dihydropteroate synthase [Bacillota bacterium]|uniref:Dihydropteroate synthase n=1 Tax=Thermanaerosceptrum fracticalcis TaxID=1712410 RepID=A0A7G6E5P3_THEFR|nr:dihydropteroate synthase [Thermanaerosceptrum fracticalcis]QNB47397.1 dihydropteroate synthase [Thermanaerosceptrum fracticalcis]
MQGPYLLDLQGKEDAEKVFYEIGCDPVGVQLMLNKAQIYPLIVKDVKSPGANALKQHMLSLGGDAVVGRGVINNSQPTSDVLLLGTLKQYKGLTEKLVYQPWGLKELGKKIKALTAQLGKKTRVEWNWADRSLTLGERTLVMGILNVTPDSFSDGAKYNTLDLARKQAIKMVEEGADIIDVGGESTRPGSRPVSLEEELNRVLPVLEVLLKELPVPISLDTYKSEVARHALFLGVHIINDVGGGKKDPHMAQVVAEKNAPVIVMHNPAEPNYRSLVPDIIEDLKESIQLYEQAGLPPEKIMVDPGIGFGKNAQQSLVVMRHLLSFQSLGKPLLLGASRKSFIGAVLDTPVNDRLEGSLAAVAWGVMKGVQAVRVHDVKETVRLVRMLEAMSSAGESDGTIR